jgi:Transposase and inactivated derivatives
MDVRLAAAVTGGEINVSAFCRERGISRETFYVWRRRYALERDLAALEPRSSVPKRSPNRTPVEVEDAVVALRKELDEAGLDAGAATIQWHLGRRGMRAVPSVATVWRILVRRGFVVPAPEKRPKASWRRFEAAAPNELWQTDATKWVIGIGQVEILTFLDDHSRLVTACRAVMTATTENTWETFCSGAELWGLPSGQLSDNGLNFSGRLRGYEVAFEINLRAAGVRPITSRPYHPQTCGKVERFQQTLKKWLRRRPLARDLVELQVQLDSFIDYYNRERPHRGIGRVTPCERWSATPKIINAGLVLPAPQRTPPSSLTGPASCESSPGSSTSE